MPNRWRSHAAASHCTGHGQKPEYDLWDVATQVNGMSAFALGTNIKSYRIITTFRLTPKSAELTKIFYSSKFRSVKKYIDFDGLDSKLFLMKEGFFISLLVDLQIRTLMRLPYCSLVN